MGARSSDNGIARLPCSAHDPSHAVMLEVLALLSRLAVADESVLRLHLGALRDVSPRVLGLVGRDVGADAMGDERQAPGLVQFLGSLEEQGALPRTIIYNLNPADNALFATIAGAFSRPGVSPLVQWGPPWWFNDHEGGIRRQLDDLSQVGMHSGFMGMLTDSRSILSMTRHELFRRILCEVIGRDVDEGRIPADLDWCSTVVRDVRVGNGVRFFGLPESWAR
jgi:glucuronate isomerase